MLGALPRSWKAARMSGKALFGRYWRASSVVHRLDPRTKILLSLAFIAIVLVAATWLQLAVCAAFTLAFFALARIPVTQALRSIAPMLVVVLLTAVFNMLFVQGGEVYLQWWVICISSDGLMRAAFMSVRLVLLLLGVSLLTLTTPNLDIAEALERLMSPLSKLRVPVHEMAMMMGIALRFLPQLADELAVIRRAQVARGARLAANPLKGGVASLSSLVVPLLASALRHADALSVAMEARCYHGAVGRTRLHPLRFAPRDAVAAAIMALMLLCVCTVAC